MSKLQIKTNWYDRIVGFFSPRAQAMRMRYRLYNSYLQRKYEGADSGRRTKGWSTGSKSANAELAGGLSKLRDRSRDLVRNNPYAARAMEVITNNVVGRGIQTQIKVDSNSEVNRREIRLNNVWRAWAFSKVCDFDGMQNFMGIQRLVMRSIAESGEVIVRLRRSSLSEVFGPDGRLYKVPPVQLQVLESDFIASTRLVGKQPNGNIVSQGIELDPSGKVVAYHLYQEHPGGIDLNIGSRFSTTRIPASEILHLYRVDRPGQLRGAPWLSPVMLRLRDFDLYEDAQLKRQQCAAMYTAFVHDLEGVDDFEEEQEEMELGEKMEPGLIEILPPGKDITLANPPGAENYDEYTSVVLHSIASGLGLTFEALTGNLKEVNFSSARMGFLEMQRNIETWRTNLMIAGFLNPTFAWFREGLDLIGENAQDARPVHTPPRREMIDPSKEVKALQTAVRSGFKTLSDAVREGGGDPDTHFTEMQQDNAVLDKLGLTLDSDPRKDTDQAEQPEDPE